jgi:cell division protein FtsN
MRNKETGEFELVVGDKQLLSGFFIGVLLLAVVFALGYELGQSRPRASKAADAAETPLAADGRPQPALGLAQSSAPEMSVGQPAQQPEPEKTAATPPAEAPPQPTTQPARETPAATKAAPPAAAAPPPTPAPQTVPAEPPPAGSYWQVTARATRSSAEAVNQTLKDQGFSSLIRPGPNNLTVVWVGPYPDKDSLAKAKKRLEDAGFSNLLKRP